ncbi:MAG: BMP family ABC transporter substrate-binding protein [Candidatus Thorarchaeota archaeon]|jgi:basic membrane protein A
MHGRSLLIVLSISVTSLLLASCSSSGASRENDCLHKIGFITDLGKIEDGGFNEAGWSGVILGAERLGLGEECYSFIETNDSADYILNIETFIDEDFDIIVTSGFGMGTATREAGRAYPDLYFIGTDQTQVDENFEPDPIDNVAGLVFHEDASGFLAGALAGLMTETNVVGGVYGCPIIPPVARFEVGYWNGAHYANPDVEVLNIHHPGSVDQCFTDPQFGAGSASALVGQGADIIFGAGGLTGNGALVAACNDEVRVIGVDLDQFYSLLEVQSCILSSATKDITNGVADLIVAVDEGRFAGGDVFGDVVLAPFHNFEDSIPADARAQLDEISQQIAAGQIDPCAPYEGSYEGTFCTPIGQ